MSYYHHLIKSGASYTARTTAFATATAITDTTILNALNTFDLGLISNGLDTKMKALYPFVGGTATTHKYNFMDARDLNAAFRLSFNGGWVHSANGALGNGTNTYMNTYFTPSINFSNNNLAGIGIYSRANETGNYFEGVVTTSTFYIYPRYTDGSVYFNNGNQDVVAANANTLGLIMGSSFSTTNRRAYKNGSLVGTNTATNTAGADAGVVWFGKGNYPTVSYSAKSYAMALLTEGMTDTDQSNLYTLTQALQTSLSRQV